MADKPFLLMPSDLRAAIGTVNSLVVSLYRALENSGASNELRADFVSFAKEWNEYRNSLSGLEITEGKSLWDYMFGPITNVLPDLDGVKLLVTGSWEKIKQFESRAEQWREELRRQGVQTRNIDINKPPKSDSGFKLPWWAWIGGGIVILYNLHPLKTAHSIRSLMPSKKSKKK